MIKINCDKCGIELDKSGGLLFTSPHLHKVRKYHLCQECLNKILIWLQVKLKNIT